jgi:hypothetical protein
MVVAAAAGDELLCLLLEGCDGMGGHVGDITKGYMRGGTAQPLGILSMPNRPHGRVILQVSVK